MQIPCGIPTVKRQSEAEDPLYATKPVPNALLGVQPKQDKRLTSPARAGSGAGHLLRRGAGRARIGLGLVRHAAPPLGLSHSIPAPASRAEGGLRWRRGPARSRRRKREAGPRRALIEGLGARPGRGYGSKYNTCEKPCAVPASGCVVIGWRPCGKWS